MSTDARPQGFVPSPLTRSERRSLLGLFLVLVAIFGVTSGGHVTSIDDEIMFQTTRSLVHLQADIDQGDPNHPQLYHRRSDGAVAGIYGIGQSIVGAPLYIVGSAAARLVPPAGRDVLVRTTTFLTNSVLTAITAVVIAVLARWYRSGFRRSVGLGVVFALGTYAWPHTGTYFSEPGTALCLLLAVLASVGWHRTGASRWGVAMGASAVTAALFRPSAAAFVPVFAVFLVWGAPVRTPREMALGLLRMGAGGAVPGLLLLASNWWRFGGPLDLGYPSFAQDYPVLRGAWNQIFSTGKGLVLYAPVVVVVAAGAVWRLGAVQRDRVLRRERTLLLAIVAINLVVFARVAFWAGDNAWGPRYVHIVLPCIVVAAAPLLPHDGWWRAIKVTGVVGGVIGAALGVLLNFNVHYIDATEALGSAPIASEGGRPKATVAVSHDPAWHPQIAHLRLLDDAWRDVVGTGSARRPDYSSDPLTHYGYYGTEPRIDFWWLWVAPTGGSAATYLLAGPLLAAGFFGARLLRMGRSPCETRSSC